MKGRYVARLPTATAPSDRDAADFRSSEEDDSAEVSVCCRFVKALKSVVLPISPTLKSARCFAEDWPDWLCNSESRLCTVVAVLVEPAALQSAATHSATLL